MPPQERRGILGVGACQVTAGRFVGRAQELARLRDLLARAAIGDGPLVALVGGEAGIGKTRLADQLAAAARGQGRRPRRPPPRSVTAGSPGPCRRRPGAGDPVPQQDYALELQLRLGEGAGLPGGDHRQ